jgi:hypothetical protein
MHWRSTQVLAQKFSQLKGERNAAARGSGLELFIADLFGHEHFRVDRENLSSNGRQVDLFLTRGQLRLLVETKWTKRPATIEEVDQLLARLQGAPPNVVGLLVSMSGFSRTAIKRVEQNAQRPVLLLTGEEVDELTERGHGLHALITWKLDHLTRHQRIKFGPDLASTPPWLLKLPEAGIQIFTPDGDELGCWESAGGFHGIIHSISLSNVDLGLGAVAIDFNLALDHATGLVDVLRRLAQAGWMTHDGAWRIEQSAASWNGFASAELARQIHNWTDRYRGTPMHHTERVIYLDHFDDGLFTLTADIDASPNRWVRWCSLSFLLTGIPLDTSPYEALTIDLPVINNPTFRSLDPNAYASGSIRRRRGTAVPQTALAHLARHSTMFGNELDGDSSTWVEGVVLRDPLPRATRARRVDIGLPADSLGSTLCWLPQQHHLTDRFLYETLHVSSVHTSDTQIVRIKSDWVGPTDSSQAAAIVPGKHSPGSPAAAALA